MKVISCLVISSLLLVSTAQAQQQFKKTEFITVIAKLAGTAEKLQFKEEELIDFAKLKIRNNIKGIPFITLEEYDSRSAEELIENDLKFDPAFDSVFSLLEFLIWTVGDDYPIAFYVDLAAGNYRKATLGYGSAEGIEQQVKKSIDGLIEDFAITFYKVRGEF